MLLLAKSSSDEKTLVFPSKENWIYPPNGISFPESAVNVNIALFALLWILRPFKSSEISLESSINRECSDSVLSRSAIALSIISLKAIWSDISFWIFCERERSLWHFQQPYQYPDHSHCCYFDQLPLPVRWPDRPVEIKSNLMHSIVYCVKSSESPSFNLHQNKSSENPKWILFMSYSTLFKRGLRNHPCFTLRHTNIKSMPEPIRAAQVPITDSGVAGVSCWVFGRRGLTEQVIDRLSDIFACVSTGVDADKKSFEREVLYRGFQRVTQ